MTYTVCLSTGLHLQLYRDIYHLVLECFERHSLHLSTKHFQVAICTMAPTSISSTFNPFSNISVGFPNALQKRQRYYQRPSTKKVIIPICVSMVLVIAAFLIAFVCIKRRDKRRLQKSHRTTNLARPMETASIDHPPVYEPATQNYPSQPPPVYSRVLRL